MSLEGVKAGLCSGAQAGKNILGKAAKNKMALTVLVASPALVAAGATKDSWGKVDENVKDGAKAAAFIGALAAGAAFLTGKASGQKGIKALTEGAKTLWTPIKNGFNTVKDELKTKASELFGKVKSNAGKILKDGKEKATELLTAAKEQATKVLSNIKSKLGKTTEA